jgi:hypothetical protein
MFLVSRDFLDVTLTDAGVFGEVMLGGTCGAGTSQYGKRSGNIVGGPR